MVAVIVALVVVWVWVVVLVMVSLVVLMPLVVVEMLLSVLVFMSALFLRLVLSACACMHHLAVRAVPATSQGGRCGMIRCFDLSRGVCRPSASTFFFPLQSVLV